MNSILVYVGLDVHKETISVALAAAGSNGPAQSLGRVPNRPEAIRRLVRKLRPGRRLVACYEAGPCGYALYRQLRQLGVECQVVAPSLIPMRPGDRIKTDRRDAARLAHLLRSGELTAVWVPDPPHEALRNLTRLRAGAHHDLTRARHRLSKFLLRLGWIPLEGVRPWTQRHRVWMRNVAIVEPLDRQVRDDYLEQVEHLAERIVRLDHVIEEVAQASPFAERIRALCTMRGVRTVTATTLVAEWGEISRFAGARQLMGFSGLVPSEFSSGSSTQRGTITKTGSSYLRRVLVESAFAYRHRPQLGGQLKLRQQGQPESVRRIAWKAQRRLHRMYARLKAQGKHNGKVVVAVAREMVGFLWAIDREMGQQTVAH